MVCFFKSIDTFETIGQAVVSDYSVPLASANGATGSVTVPGELTQDYTRQWLILGDQLLYITAVTPQDNMTTIAVGDTLSAFNRPIAYEEPTTYYLGEYIKALAESEYINQSDPYFDMPYLTATNSDTTEFAHVAPNDNITSLETVARGAQAQGVSIVFSFDADSVTMAISTASTTTQSMVMGDGHSELIEETYNRELISKVTVISVLGYPHYYYKTLTGEIVTEAPVNRPPGEWVTVLQNSELNLLDTAKAAFAASVNSHKIVFYSSVDLSLFQYLRVRLNGKVYDTQVTYKGIQALDRRFLYECGDAATTLTDKIAALTRATAQINSSIPTAVGQLINDAGYITSAGTAAKVAHALTLGDANHIGGVKTFDGSNAVSVTPQNFLQLSYAAIPSVDKPSTWGALGTGFVYVDPTVLPSLGRYTTLLNMFTATTVIRQIAVGSDGAVFSRAGNYGASGSDTWTAWKQCAFTNDIPTAVSELTNDVVSYAISSTISGSMASSTWTNLASVTLPKAGNYIVSGKARFSTNATGYRRLVVSTGTDPATFTQWTFYLTDIRPAVSGQFTELSVCAPVHVSAATTLYLWGWQNSGASLTMNNGGISYLKISD